MARKNYQPKDKDKPFPSMLRRLMKERGITQEELGKAIGKARPTISCYTNGSAFPDAETIVALAKFFNTSTDNLLGVPQDARSADETRSMCEYLGISNEALDHIRILSTFRCFDDVMKAEWLFSLIQAVDMLRYHVTEAALPQMNMTQVKKSIRNSVYDVMEYSQNLADEVSGYRMAEKFVTQRINESRDQYIQYLDDLKTNLDRED